MVVVESNQLIIVALVFSLLISVVQWLIAIWVKARLEKSIEHEYAKELEHYRQSVIRREKAAKVAEFFSLWTKYRGLEYEKLSEEELFEYYARLNRMSFELSLWVEDENLLKEMMDLVQDKPGAQNVREIIVRFRDLILQTKRDSFGQDHIVLWPKSEIAANLFKKL